MNASTRRRKSKGRWMKVRDPKLIRDYMALKDFSQARLSRYAGCSRQFIWQMLNDPAKRTCTFEVGSRIEEALAVLPGTLFVPSVSREERPAVKVRRTAA